MYTWGVCMCAWKRGRETWSLNTSSYNPRTINLWRLATLRPATPHRSSPPLTRNQHAPPAPSMSTAAGSSSAVTVPTVAPHPQEKDYINIERHVDIKSLRHLEHIYFYSTKMYNVLILPPCHHCPHPSVSSLSSFLSSLNPMIHHYYSSLASTSSSLLLCHRIVLVNSWAWLNPTFCLFSCQHPCT